jgi:zinc D-Ala-D-Ala carboxypeptidase
MKLSENFTLEELIATKTGLFNDPGKNEIHALAALVTNVLQPVRTIYGKPIKLNSGYRSTKVNTSVGGVSSSQHLKGEAADITCGNNQELFNLIIEHGVFDQLIWEFGTDDQPDWIHVSYSLNRNRKNVLRSVKSHGKIIYKPF